MLCVCLLRNNTRRCNDLLLSGLMPFCVESFGKPYRVIYNSRPATLCDWNFDIVEHSAFTDLLMKTSFSIFLYIYSIHLDLVVCWW